MNSIVKNFERYWHNGVLEYNFEYNVKFIRLEEKSMNNLNAKQVKKIIDLPIVVNEV